MTGSWALATTIPGSLKLALEILTEIGNLDTEKRLRRMHDTLEAGLQRVSRSLVAPTRGAGVILNYNE